MNKEKCFMEDGNCSKILFRVKIAKEKEVILCEKHFEETKYELKDKGKNIEILDIVK